MCVCVCVCLCVCVCVCVCVFSLLCVCTWMGKYRAQFPRMGHNTWLYVTSLSISLSGEAWSGNLLENSPR